jgi:hypothetical protein
MEGAPMTTSMCQKCGKPARGYERCWRCERDTRELVAYQAGRAAGYREGLDHGHRAGYQSGLADGRAEVERRLARGAA